MDPASALGVASAVIAFIEFSTELIGGACEIYKSLDGKTAENAHIELIVEDLSRASRSLRLPSATADGAMTAYDKDIMDLSTKCQKKCDALLAIFTQLRPTSRSTWASVRSAWMARRKQGDIAGIHAALRDYRSAMLLRMAQRQSERGGYVEATLAELVSHLTLQDTKDTSVTQRIQTQLYFDALYAREDGIKTPEADTFDWIRSDTALQDNDQVPRRFVVDQKSARETFRAQYLAWLGNSASSSSSSSSSDVSALHISGKAGSGKSTLMRHLFQDDFTKDCLQAWAGHRKLICVSFYFWVASRDHYQTSVEGLYRTVLYKALQQCPEIAAYLFPEQWEAMRYSPRAGAHGHDERLDATLFRKDALAAAMERLTAIDAVMDVPYVLVMYVDGLDEHEEKASDWGSGTATADPSTSYKTLARNLVRWGRSRHVKICTSARPYTEFLDIFERARVPILSIHTSTICDIYRCARSMFEADECFDEFEPSDHLRLCEQIANMASGVFVWAILTVRAMIVSLSLGDSRDTQDAKLKAIPAQLNDLYTLLLDQVDDEDRERSNRLLLLAASERIHEPYYRVTALRLSLYWVPWVERLTDPDFLKDPVICAPYTDKQSAQRFLVARRLLSRLTKGILEVEASSIARAPGGVFINFSHRTARDYVDMRIAQGRLTSSLDFQAVDVYGRLRLASFLYVCPNVRSVAFQIAYYLHDGSFATLRLLCDALARSIEAGALYDGGPSFAAGSGEGLFGFETRLDMAFRGAGSAAFGPPDTRAPPARIPAVGLPAFVVMQSSSPLNPASTLRMPWFVPLPAVGKVLVLLKIAQHRVDDCAKLLRFLPVDEEFEACLYSCDTAVHGLPVPPWMVMLGHLVDALYGSPQAFSILNDPFRTIMPPEARPSTTITFIDSPTTPVDMDAVQKLADETVQKLIDESDTAEQETRHILSIDYGEYHLSGDFRYYVTCLPEDPI